MAINEGTIDRVIRIVLGLAIFSLMFIGPRTTWGLVGLAPLLTGALGYCPLYRVVGLSTCPMERHAHS